MRGKAVQLGCKETFSRQIGPTPTAFGFLKEPKRLSPLAFSFYNVPMKKAMPLLLFPLLLLPSCSLDQGVLSPEYQPNPNLGYVLRNGDAFLGGSISFAEDPDLSLGGQRISKEALLFYFSRESCHYCQEVRPGFDSFLEQTNIKVISLTNNSSPSYSQVASYLEAAYPEAGKAFFSDWGTPLLFALKDGEFSKIEIYGNHKNAGAVSKLLTPLYSFPYIYELSSFEKIPAFLEKGYPFLICQSEEDFSLLYSFASSSKSPSGVLFKNKLSEENQAELVSRYGDSSRLLFQKKNLDLSSDKTGCASVLEDYFKS